MTADSRLAFLTARAWLDDDGTHIWHRHECLGSLIEHILPPPWHVVGDAVEPSINCSVCGLHYFAKIEEKPND